MTLSRDNRQAPAVHQGGNSPSEDLQRERGLLVPAADGVPQLFFYRWDATVLVLGSGQDVNDPRWKVCEPLGITVHKRKTGGTGVLHQGNLNVGLALPTSHPWGKNVRLLYDRFLDMVEGALGDVGITVERTTTPAPPIALRSAICFLDHTVESLLIDGRKILGCAQTRKRDAVLVHGSISGQLDAALHQEIFGVPAAEVDRYLAPLITSDKLANTLRAALETQAIRAMAFV